MRAYATDAFAIPLPAGHPFPLAKYRLLREVLLADGTVDAADVVPGPRADDRDLLRAHDAGYVARVRRGDLTAAEVRALGFPWSPQLVERSLRSCGATVAAARHAAARGTAVYLGGGTHHAFADRGGGYCVFNDVAVAARMLLAEELAQRIAVVDCDVHQGDGTAAMLADEPRAFTFSIHGARNYPRIKQRSDLDVALPCGCGDADYLAALAPALDETFARARPDFVFYLAGADPHRGDRFGRMQLTADGLAARDAMVLDRVAAAGARLVVTMAGGYGRDVRDTVAVHAATVRAVRDHARRQPAVRVDG